MITYYETKAKVLKILEENNISAFDFVRIAKDLCTCKTCKFFVHHYDKDGNEISFGHCVSGNTPKARQPYQSCCGSWDIGSENNV